MKGGEGREIVIGDDAVVEPTGANPFDKNKERKYGDREARMKR